MASFPDGDRERDVAGALFVDRGPPAVLMGLPDAPGYQLVLGGDATHELGGLFPPGLVAVLAMGSVAPDPLFADEASLVAHAIERRRLEFGRGRSCARRAMRELGLGSMPVLADARRAPRWPDGVVGSISHCRDCCCAVVGRSDQWAAIGVDVELLVAPHAEVEERIASVAERRALAAMDAAVPWTCVLFSIKECVYKAWNPLTGGWLDFDDVEVRLSPESGRFEADISKSAPSAPRLVEGRFHLYGRRVLSFLAIARAR